MYEFIMYLIKMLHIKRHFHQKTANYLFDLQIIYFIASSRQEGILGASSS